MWKNLILVSAGFCAFFYFVTVSFGAVEVKDIVWKEVSRGVKDLDLRAVAVSTDSPDVVYIGSSNVIYKTINGGKQWDEVLTFRGTENEINYIAINSQDEEIIYAGTRQGLYESKNSGGSWKKIFKGVGDLESSVLSIADYQLNSEFIFIGTESGMFLTKNGGSKWERIKKIPSETAIYSIAVNSNNPEMIYAATNRGIYQSLDSGEKWNRVFGNRISSGDYDSSYDSVETDSDNIGIKVSSIAFDLTDGVTVFAGTSAGLFSAKDDGLLWKRVSNEGLISNNLRHIVISRSDPDGVYAATGRGVFRYSKASASWKELYKGITATDIRFLAFDNRKFPTLWTATKGGVLKTFKRPLFSMKEGHYNKSELREAYSYFDYEPTIQEIQKAAIRYAEVYPEKIERWRDAASKRAWLPDLSVNYGEDWQSSTYFYSTGSEKYTNDDITVGDDWSISLTWKLGDLIWNDDQTSIDTRSRLVVQLRGDVVNEVTRLYYERRRLQFEMLIISTDDVMERIENELRLQELTADIDALTGFYLSKRLVQVRKIRDN